MLQNVAPSGQVCAYDKLHLPIYAELLDADAAGVHWAEGARSILRMEDATDSEILRCCWESHLERARWIVGEGLASAISTFNRQVATSSAD